MAASFSASHDEEVEALVLLAAYSTEDLNGLDMDVYSFYGSEDKVLNMEKYEEYRGNLPEDVVEEVKRLASNGYQEIVLTGIHLSSYGRTSYEQKTEAESTELIKKNKQPSCPHCKRKNNSMASK